MKYIDRQNTMHTHSIKIASIIKEATDLPIHMNIWPKKISAILSIDHH